MFRRQKSKSAPAAYRSRGYLASRYKLFYILNLNRSSYGCRLELVQSFPVIVYTAVSSPYTTLAIHPTASLQSS